MRYLQVKEFLGRRNCISVFDMCEELMGECRYRRRQMEEYLIYKKMRSYAERKRRFSILVARIGLVQKEANSDIVDRLAGIESGSGASLVEIHEGYRAECGSLGRSEMRERAVYKRYGPRNAAHLMNSELVGRYTDADLKSLVYIYGRRKRSCMVGADKEGVSVDVKSYYRSIAEI